MHVAMFFETERPRIFVTAAVAILERDYGIFPFSVLALALSCYNRVPAAFVPSYRCRKLPVLPILGNRAGMKPGSYPIV